jgi:ABC-type bacteriocin/lantibiotic exporter with double-glycine peptidase domain
VLTALLLSSVLAVPFVPQAKDTCGAAALTMVLRYWGDDAGHDEIAAQAADGAGEAGFTSGRLAEIARGRGHYAVVYEGDLDNLRAFVAKGRPLIVALSEGRGRFHDVVVTGFDADRDEVVVNDPAAGRDRRLARGPFERRWREAGHVTLLVLPKQP